MKYGNDKITQLANDIVANHIIKLHRLSDKHQYTNIESKHKFYKRFSNLNKIIFDNSEINLMEKGLRLNDPLINKLLIERTVINVDTAIKTLSCPKV